MLLTLFYEALLGLALLFWLPLALYKRFKTGKYSRSLPQRLGMNLPSIKRGEGPLIWLHAVSVGEAKAAVPLLKQLRKSHPDAQFIFTSITETGFDEAKRSIDFPCAHFFLPFDLSFMLRPIIEKLRPDLLIFSETDLWLRLMTLARQYGAKIALVNGKISERSTKRLKQIPLFARALLDPIDLFCVQDEIYQKRFSSLGVLQEKLVVSGNLKYDFNAPHLSQEEKQTLRDTLSITRDKSTVVIGSTHAGEERLILEALKNLPECKILLVPRHPERFDEVADLLNELRLPFTRYTDDKEHNERIVLVDTMGLLVSLYQIADVAIIGGSFVQGIGGHNILEPGRFEVPVIFGPYMENQQEMTHLLLERQGGLQLRVEQLLPSLKTLFESGEERRRIGEAGRQLTQEITGATEKTEKLLNNLLAKKSAL